MEGKKDLVYQVFCNLYRWLGPRYWWPASTTWEVMVGAVLTQNVTWRNVEKAITNLHQAMLLEIEPMLAASEDQVAALIVPTRYYNSKAKKLKALAEYVRQQYQGDLEGMFRQDWRILRRQLLGVYGIGPETADSILLYAGNQPVFVIDAYTKRIWRRLGLSGSDATYQELQLYFSAHLPPLAPLYNEYHALLVGLGNQLCRASRPGCDRCPLLTLCPSGQQMVGANSDNIMTRK